MIIDFPIKPSVCNDITRQNLIASMSKLPESSKLRKNMKEGVQALNDGGYSKDSKKITKQKELIHALEFALEKAKEGLRELQNKEGK